LRNGRLEERAREGLSRKAATRWAEQEHSAASRMRFIDSRQRRKGAAMPIWLLILIIVLVVLALGGGFGYRRR